MFVRCKTSFFAVGRPTMVRAGQLFRSDDPLVVGREDLFDAVEDVVESASAAPGELRSVKRAVKKAAARRVEDDADL